MASRRALLLPRDATNEGSRQLRELLLRQSFGGIARRLSCDESSVRRWAREIVKPDRIMRAKIEQRLGIRAHAWDEPLEADVYAGDDPRTSRIIVPSTKPRAC